MTHTHSDRTDLLPLDAGAEHLTEVLQLQRARFLREGPPTVADRLDRIDRFVAGVLDHADELSDALTADYGHRPARVNFGADILGAIAALNHVREHLADWVEDEQVPGSVESSTPTVVQSRPKGVVGVIGAWNFPVTLAVNPTIDALAAGNRVMIKFSDIPHRTAEVFARAVASRMRLDEVCVVRGGVETSQHFASLPLDHILFTGSPAVGARVAEAAGRNLVPLTLELGGKNPVVIGPGADLGMAANRIASFRLFNGGQICLCPDVVYVPEKQVDELVQRYIDATGARFGEYVDSPLAVSVVNDQNFRRITALVEDAEAKGARVITVGSVGYGALDPSSRLIPPTVITGVTPDMRIASEEIFGPVIVVRGFENIDTVIQEIAGQPSPLGAYWFGDDTPEYRRFLHYTTSGGVTRNDIGLHFSIEGAPSGGIGNSGMGAYTGKTGFDTFSHRRTIAVSELGGSPSDGMYSSDAADDFRAIILRAQDELNQRIEAHGSGN